jgi:hypothetical protein
VAAEYDKTSFGIQRKRDDAVRICGARNVTIERLKFVTNPEKRERLERLLAAIDDVLLDLNS